MASDLPSGPRAALAEAAALRGEDLAALSRLIGRNPAYIQQFVRRGIPRKLDGDDRRTLARYLRIEESLLGGEAPPPQAELVPVPRLAIAAAAGAGAAATDETPRDRLGFSSAFLREVTGGRPGHASILTVLGDSMLPVLGPGDDILVVARQPGEPIRDGIHVVRLDDLLLVKRVTAEPGGALTLISDNPAYPPRTARAGEAEVIGRVVWAGRRL